MNAAQAFGAGVFLATFFFVGLAIAACGIKRLKDGPWRPKF